MKKCLILILCLCLALPLTASAESWLSEKDGTLANPAKAVDVELTDAGATIPEAGVYRLSGEIANGCIRVSLAEKGDVWLLLDGVSVHNESGAALTSSGCKKLILTLAEGSANTLSQGSTEPLAEDNDAAVYVRDDLTINGTGALLIEGGYRDGINCRDSLRIAGGQITVNAVDDGIVGKDEVVIADGEVSVAAQTGDGIKATNDEDEKRGFVAIAGGRVSVATGEGSASATRTARDGWGRWDTAPSENSTASQKGIKAKTSLNISGGELTVDSVDDALHANSIAISGGKLTLSSGDDGAHADSELAISGGELSVLRSYEGLEATNIVISGGELDVRASDDGINGAGGDSGSTTADGGWGGGWGRHGRDMFSASSGTLTIRSDRVRVQAEGDGVDVNGSISMSGGELYVRGPQSSANGALDYDGSFTLTGGTLVAIGSSGMAQGVSAPAISGVETRANASGAVVLLDASGAELVRMEADGSYEHVVVYADVLTEGSSYTLALGGSQQTVTASKQGSSGFGMRQGGGGFGGGEKPGGGRR